MSAGGGGNTMWNQGGQRGFVPNTPGAGPTGLPQSPTTPLTPASPQNTIPYEPLQKPSSPLTPVTPAGVGQLPPNAIGAWAQQYGGQSFAPQMPTSYGGSPFVGMLSRMGK